MAVQGAVTLTVGAAPEAVWPWVSDLSRHGEWSPKPYRVELVSGEPGAVGSRYRSVGWVPPNDGAHVNDVEIVEVVPLSRFVLHAHDENGRFENVYELRAVPGGSEVSFHLAFPPMSGLNAVLVPILFPLVAKSDMRKRLSLLKQRVESTR